MSSDKKSKAEDPAVENGVNKSGNGVTNKPKPVFIPIEQIVDVFSLSLRDRAAAIKKYKNKQRTKDQWRELLMKDFNIG